jgi:hypothetical protein
VENRLKHFGLFMQPMSPLNVSNATKKILKGFFLLSLRMANQNLHLRHLLAAVEAAPGDLVLPVDIEVKWNSKIKISSFRAAQVVLVWLCQKNLLR